MKTSLAQRFLAFSFCLSLVISAAPQGSAIAASDPNQVSNAAAMLNNDGVKALNSGNFQLAIQKFEEALKLVPNYKFAIDNLAIAYNNYGLKLPPAQGLRQFHKSLFWNPTNATTSQNLENVIQFLGKNPRNPKDRIELAKQARMSGDFEGAIVEYQAASRIQPDGKTFEDLGDVYRVRADDQRGLDNAIQAYQSAIRTGGMEPASTAMVYVKLGQAFQAKKDLPHAIEAFGNAIKFKSDDKEVLEALKTGWEEALRENPTAPENHIGLGQALQYLGDFGQAEAEYNQALRLDKNNQIARKLLAGLGDARKQAEIAKHINAGVDYQSRKMYDDAIREYTQALTSDPSNASLWVNIGTAFQAKSDYARALQAYNKALAIQPGNKDALTGIKSSTDQKNTADLADMVKQAADAYKAGKYAESLALYQKVLVKTPNDAAIHFNIGAALQQLKRMDEAIAAYKQAVALDAKNASYKEFLEKAMGLAADPIIEQGLAKHTKKDYVGAIELYQKALNYTPKNAALYFNLAGANYSLQRYVDAKRAYEKALEVDPKGQIDDLWLIGSINEHNGDGYAALEVYRQYITKAPSGKYVTPAKARIEALVKNPKDTVKIKSEDELAKIKSGEEAYQTALKLRTDKKFDEAISAMQKAIDLVPTESAYPFGMYLLYLDKVDYTNARSWVQKAIAMDAKNAEYAKALDYLNAQEAQKVVESAIAKQQKEDFAGAIAQYQEALKLVPKNARIWTNLASAYQGTDDLANAFAAYEKATTLDPKAEATDFYPMGLIDEHFGRGPAAIAKYKRFLATNPTGDLANQANARIKALTANPNDTQKIPKREEQKTIAAAMTAFDEGRKLQEAKKFPEALELYKKSAMLNPKEAAFAIGVAACYQAMNDLPNASIWYQKAAELDPKNKEYKQYLAGVNEAIAAPVVEDAAKKFTAQDFAGAIDLYRKALQTVPNNASVHMDLASALQQSDDFTNARTEYQKAYELDPKGAGEALYFVAALNDHFRQGPQALADYRKYMTTMPGGKFVQYAKQRAEALAKNPNATVQLPTREQAKNAAQVQALFDEAVKLQGEKKYDEADAKYAEVIALVPKEASYWYARGTNAQAKGDVDGAIKYYGEANRLDPAAKDYKQLLTAAQEGKAGAIAAEAVQKQSSGDIPGAIELYKQALAVVPKNAKLHTNLGIAYQNMDNFAAAREEYMLGYNNDNKGEIDNLFLVANIDEHYGKGKEALANYTKYLQYAPKGTYAKQANDRYQKLYFNPNAVQRLTTQAEAQQSTAANDAYQAGIKLQQENKLDEALAKYDEALKVVPNADYVWFAKGTAHQAKGENDKALAAYLKAQQLNAKEAQYKTVYQQLKQAMAAPFLDEAYKKQTTKNDKGEYDLPGAITSYLEALKMSDDANTHTNLGTAYQANKELQKARAEYTRALQMDAKQFDAYYYLGTVNEGLNDKPNAIVNYRKYLQFQPNGPNAADSKARLKILGVPVK
jgi:tetratricopeptide (TPR) repeat protein